MNRCLSFEICRMGKQGKYGQLVYSYNVQRLMGGGIDFFPCGLFEVRWRLSIPARSGVVSLCLPALLKNQLTQLLPGWGLIWDGLAVPSPGPLKEGDSPGTFPFEDSFHLTAHRECVSLFSFIFQNT